MNSPAKVKVHKITWYTVLPIVKQILSASWQLPVVIPKQGIPYTVYPKNIQKSTVVYQVPHSNGKFGVYLNIETPSNDL